MCSARSAGTSPSDVQRAGEDRRVGLVDADLVGERPAVEVRQQAAAARGIRAGARRGEPDIADDPGADAATCELRERLLQPLVDEQVRGRPGVGERLDQVLAQAVDTTTPRSSTARSAAMTGVNWRPERQCSLWILQVSSNARRTASGGTSLSRRSSLQARVRRSSSDSVASRAIVSQKS